MNKFIFYIKKRFPVVPMFIYCYLIVLATQHYIYGLSPIFNLDAILLSLIYLGFFLHLRFLDEFKDYKYDSTNHPERPVQSGFVSLRDIRAYFFINLLWISILCVFTNSTFALLPLLMGFIYSAFMYREFFMPNLKHTRVLVYITLHECVFIPIYFFILSVISGKLWFPTALSDYLLLLFFLMTVFLIEVGRKLNHRYNSDGQKTDDTYVFIWGESKAVKVFCTLIFIQFLSLYLITKSLLFSLPLAFLALIVYLMAKKNINIIMKNHMILTVCAIYFGLFLLIGAPIWS